METNLKITDIKNVYDGEFKIGKMPKKSVGRHCDCFVYYLYGKAEYSFNNYSFTATPQEIMYLAKDSIYSINILEKSKFICIDFDFSEKKLYEKSSIFKLNSKYTENEFTKILHIWNAKNKNYFPKVFSLVYNLYSDIIKSENRVYSKKSELLSEIISYILQHYCEPEFSVDNTARHFKLSEVHLRRIFKQNMYVSPIKYINNLKTDKAKNMLTVSNYTISEIAKSIGFDDPYYFSRFFKKETGASPSDYRKNSSIH